MDTMPHHFILITDGNEYTGGGVRTHTSLRIPDFESSASASFATPANPNILSSSCSDIARGMHDAEICGLKREERLIKNHDKEHKKIFTKLSPLGMKEHV